MKNEVISPKFSTHLYFFDNFFSFSPHQHTKHFLITYSSTIKSISSLTINQLNDLKDNQNKLKYNIPKISITIIPLLRRLDIWVNPLWCTSPVFYTRGRVRFFPSGGSSLWSTRPSGFPRSPPCPRAPGLFLCRSV